MSGVVLYSKPDCVQCDRTKKLFETKGVIYTEVDLTKDSGAFKFVTEKLGYSAAPVVVTETDHWYGFRPDKISQINKTL